MKRQQSGFTLIELIMVIVILGILSAFALPKFADLSGDAEQAAMEGARAAVKSASAIARSAALVNSAAATVDLEDVTVNITNGYADADDICDAAGASGDFTCAVASGVTTVSTSGAEGDPCFTYTEAANDGDVPAITALGALNNATPAVCVIP